MLVHHPGRRGERNGFREQNSPSCWRPLTSSSAGGSCSTQHKDALMRELLAARRRWVAVFRLPAYAPELNPAEGVWANLKNYLGNLAACTVDTLADLTRTRLKKM
ncbi:transposase [Streptomyces sp. NPDC050523]|uniref:transposase n=1 Tax=Streptomyces sp. NPDC050523 TaxID=3365622 RepID=UPI0037B37961